MLNPSFEPDIDRLSALYRYGAPDTLDDSFIQAVTGKLAAGFGDMTVQAVLVDDHRLVTVASSGPSRDEGGKLLSLAAAAIEQTTPLIADDLMESRFANSPSVRQAPHLRAYAAVALRTPDNHAIGVLAVSDTRVRAFVQGHADLLGRGAARIMERLELLRQARLDAQTGALHREAFHTHVNALAAVANRHRFPTSLLAVDLQALRSLLQNFRADLGGLVIDRISGLGRKSVRRLDAFGRLEDNIFAVLLPNADETGARVLGRRIAQGLVDSSSGPPQSADIMPAGIGIAVLRPGVDEAADLIDRAVRDSRRSWLADLRRATDASQVA